MGGDEQCPYCTVHLPTLWRRLLGRMSTEVTHHQFCVLLNHDWYLLLTTLHMVWRSIGHTIHTIKKSNNNNDNNDNKFYYLLCTMYYYNYWLSMSNIIINWELIRHQMNHLILTIRLDNKIFISIPHYKTLSTRKWLMDFWFLRKHYSTIVYFFSTFKTAWRPYHLITLYL